MKMFGKNIVAKYTETWKPMEKHVVFAKTTLSYQLPFNRIKPLDWITSNYKYSGSYDWQLGAEIRNQDNFGNTITNSNTQSLDNTFNFTRLYNKSKYLNDVNKRMKSKGTNQTKKKKP